MSSEAWNGRVDSEVFAPVAGSRVSSAIVTQIRELIAAGNLEPGDRLPPERELAERFGVSRVSVRDALRVLEVLGLLEIRVGAAGGAFVTAPSSRIVGEGVQNLLMMSLATPEHVAESRLVIELGIVTLACERATDSDIERLRMRVEEGVAALEQQTYEARHSEEFHASLAEATHNPALMLLAESFRGPLSLAALRARAPDDEAERHARSVDDHRELVAALSERDVARARRCLVVHLTRGLAEDRREFLMAAFPYGDLHEGEPSGGRRRRRR